MANENMQTNTPNNQPIPFGARFQSAREALGIERKDAAAQLRLNESVIESLEKDSYPSDLPITFVRGYIRLYGKFLSLPDYEIKQALEPIKPTITENLPTIKPMTSLTSSNYFMQIFTSIIISTLLALIITWWYAHNKSPSPVIENKTLELPINTTDANATTNAAVTNQPIAPTETLAPKENSTKTAKNSDNNITAKIANNNSANDADEEENTNNDELEEANNTD